MTGSITRAPYKSSMSFIARNGQDSAPPSRLLRVWLLVLFKLVALMVVVGGLTRLTDSGLSITEWAPIRGALPPLSAEAWQQEFLRYQEIPEYVIQNAGMSLEEFKTIYWWEWGHRQLGRVVGIVWFFGFVGLSLKGTLNRTWVLRMVILGALGGLQGFVGWWMVSSGLEEGMLDVASYRLATHLGLAFAILGLITWYLADLRPAAASSQVTRETINIGIRRASKVLLVLIFCQILLGALVAGIDAGRSFTEWPLMGGQFFPATAFDIAPLWRNFFENPGLVQFIHRIFGYAVFIATLLYVIAMLSKHGLRQSRTSIVVFGSILLQMLVGIVTVLSAAHLHVAITHQALAIAIWVLIVSETHRVQQLSGFGGPKMRASAN